MCNAWRRAKHYRAESKHNPNIRAKESIMKMFPITVTGAGATAAVALELAGPASATAPELLTSRQGPCHQARFLAEY
jgi:hypothetical protein